MEKSSKDFDMVLAMLHAMKKQEELYYSWNSNIETMLRKERRGSLAHWCFLITKQFKIPHEVVGLCMNHVDRFCSYHGFNNQDMCETEREDLLKLIVVTALYISLKTLYGSDTGVKASSTSSNGQDDRITSTGAQHLRRQRVNQLIKNVHHLTGDENGKNCRSMQHIVKMEQLMFQTLRFYLNPPLATHFVQHYVQQLLPLLIEPYSPCHCTEKLLGLLDHALELAEMSIMDYGLITIRPHIVGLACVLLALESTQEEATDENSTGNPTKCHAHRSLDKVPWQDQCQLFLKLYVLSPDVKGSSAFNGITPGNLNMPQIYKPDETLRLCKKSFQNLQRAQDLIRQHVSCDLGQVWLAPESKSPSSPTSVVQTSSEMQGKSV